MIAVDLKNSVYAKTMSVTQMPDGVGSCPRGCLQIVCTHGLRPHTACVAASRHSLSWSPLASPKLSKQHKALSSWLQVRSYPLVLLFENFNGNGIMCIITCIGGGGGGTRGASGHTRPTLNESCPPILCQGCQTRGACSSFRERVLLQPLLPSLSGAPVHRDNPRGFWRTRTQRTPSLRQGMRTSPGPRRGPWTCGRTFANSLVNATSHAIR